jgi:hypothetical protein
MIEKNIQPNLTLKIQKSEIFKLKNPIQSNNPIQIQQKSENLFFWIFGFRFGWMFNHPSNPKSRKNLAS